MMRWKGNGASSLAVLLWCSILEGVLVVLIGLLSPFWLPLRLYRAREAVAGRRRMLLLPDRSGSEDGSNVDESFVGKGGQGRGEVKSWTQEHAKAAAPVTVVEGLPDLGRRYLDFLAQALGRSREAAMAPAAPAPYIHGGGLPRYSDAPPENFYIDVSAYDEVVLTTEWEADGFLAACMLFAIVTAEARRAPVLPGLAERPYPLRTVIVGEGKTAQALEAIAAMRQTELIPPGCHIDVVEGRCATATTATVNKSQQESEQGDQEEEGVEEEEDKGGASRSFLAACSTPLLPLLKSLVLRSIFGRFCCMSGAQRRRRRRQLDSAGAKLRELFAANRRQNQRVLVIALKPPQDLVEVLLEGKQGWSSSSSSSSWWWRWIPKRRRGGTFEHVDLLVSGGFSSAFAAAGDGGKGDPQWSQRRGRSPTSRGNNAAGKLLSRDKAEEAMAQVNRVFIVQLDDLAGPYGFPRAIAPDRTPTLSAAMAGARGILPSCLRRVIAASNHLALTGFPDKVASAISAGRYSNEELRATASSIAAAAAAAEEPGMGRGRVAELGACMADLIASDYEALEAAGLRPGTQQALFRSLDVGMALADVTAAWALACQDAVHWESCPRVGIDASAGRVVPLHDGGGAREGYARKYDYGRRQSSKKGERFSEESVRRGVREFCDDVDDFEDGGDFGDFKGGKGDVRGGKGEQQQQQSEAAAASVRNSEGVCGRVSGVLATGFAGGFERLEDQEAGYAAFAAFLVRVLDQMP
ncbi:unnamed protein product [Pylaiella littoralis]